VKIASFIFIQQMFSVAKAKRQQHGFICAKAKRQQHGFICAKAKRQQQMFSVAKAKRQLQLRQGEIDCKISHIEKTLKSKEDFGVFC